MTVEERILDELGQLRTSNAQTRGELIGRLDGIGSKLEEHGHRFGEHDNRLTELEKWKERVEGRHEAATDLLKEFRNLLARVESLERENARLSGRENGAGAVSGRIWMFILPVLVAIATGLLSPLLTH